MSAAKCIILLFIFGTITAVKKNFDGYKLYKVIPQTTDQVQILTDIHANGVGESWEEHFAINKTSKIMVSMENQPVFLSKISSAGIHADVVIEDLQKIIDDQLRPAANRNNRNNDSLLSMSWDKYHTLEEIYTWLDELESTYPNIVTTVVIGQTNENRDIKGIVINYNPERANKLIGMIEGALHAREWISPATVTFIIKEFLTSTNPEVRTLAENFEWHLFPVVNPDGYSYTFTDNRMWRKNRNTIYNTTCNVGVDDDMSNGVDLNRNFGHQWMVTGASADQCLNVFAGPAAFSEPESRAIAQYVMARKEEGDFIYYIAFHSYTQLVVIPYSHVDNAEQLISELNYGDMFEIGSRSADKLRQRFGTNYRVGISADIMYPMSGTSFDWVKYQAEVPVAYLLELRDLGNFGFLLPSEEIYPNGLEIMDFILEMDRSTRILRYYSSNSNVAVVSLTVLLFSFVYVLFVN